MANCQVCHGTQSGKGGVVDAPSHNETGHTWHHPDAQLTDWVLNGKITGAMPGFGERLSEAEVNAVPSASAYTQRAKAAPTPDPTLARYMGM